MQNWELFLIFSCTSVLYALFKVLYKSKCTKIKLGCLEIDRDVQLESEGDLSAVSVEESQ